MRNRILLIVLLLKLAATAGGQQLAHGQWTVEDEPGVTVGAATHVGHRTVVGCAESCLQGGCRCGAGSAGPAWWVAADFLYVRPHFSEAVAFAEGSQSLSSYDISGRPIHFGYDPSVRAFVGRMFADGSEGVRFGYTRMEGDVDIDSGLGSNQFIVDPFGNVVGSVTIIDPSDNRFNTTVVGGDFIRTNSTVETHVYDVDYVKVWDDYRGWSFQWEVGARIADVTQTYDATITNGPATVSAGAFAVDFIGAGPRVGLQAEKRAGPAGNLRFAASAHGSLLLGDYDVSSSTSIGGGAFIASQSHTQRRTIPMFETEVSAGWQATDALQLSAGWLFHLWNDMGVSGGTFGGLFNGADDGNNMSFDGLFLRAEWRR